MAAALIRAAAIVVQATSAREKASRQAGRRRWLEQVTMEEGPLLKQAQAPAKARFRAPEHLLGALYGNCSLQNPVAATAAVAVETVVTVAVRSKRSTDKSSDSTALTGLCGTIRKNR